MTSQLPTRPVNPAGCLIPDQPANAGTRLGDKIFF